MFLKKERREVSKEEILDSVVPALVSSGTFYGLYKEDTAHISYGEDIEIIFKMRINHEEYGDVSGVFTSQSLQELDMSIADLFTKAMENVEGTFTVRGLHGVLTAMMKAIGKDPLELGEDAREGSKMLYVLTTKDCRDGAVAMISPSALQMAAQTVGGDYYLIPSSVHELLILKDTPEVDPRFLIRILRDINRGVVSPWEVLSDNLYKYSCKDKAVIKVEERVYA